MPSDAISFLAVDEVLVIHQRLIEALGRTPGIRDPGLLKSALHRPLSGYYCILAEMAAALFEPLLINRAFADGNKRVAFFATDVFLRLNGWNLVVAAEEAHAFLRGLPDEREPTFEHLLPWIRHATTQLKI